MGRMPIFRSKLKTMITGQFWPIILFFWGFDCTGLIGSGCVLHSLSGLAGVARACVRAVVLACVRAYVWLPFLWFHVCALSRACAGVRTCVRACGARVCVCACVRLRWAVVRLSGPVFVER